MSNDKESEKLSRRKSKGSCTMLIRAGLAGPKARAKAVVDGNGVNIPRPVGRDELRKLFLLIGLEGPRSSSRK